MNQPIEERLTFTLHGLSAEEIDDFVVTLRRSRLRVDENTHRDVGTLLHTVHVFLQAYGTELGLATTLIGWLNEWRKRKAAEKEARDAAVPADIVLARTGPNGLSELSLRTASDDAVRAALRGDAGVR